MDRLRANGNIRAGLGAAAIALAVFVLTFYAAVLYVGRDDRPGLDRGGRHRL